MKNLFLLTMLLMIMGTHSFALNHSGTISSSETWFSSDNPHIITGNIVVAAGAILTIEPGCEIYFNGNFRFEVRGALIADGTMNSPIIFTSNNAIPAKGDWRYISFNNPDSGSVMNYCEISYGGSLGVRGMVMFENASNGLIISNTTLSHSASYGFVYWNNTADPQILDCTVTDSDNYPVRIFADRVKDLSGNMVFTGNTPNEILVRSQAINSGTWSNFGVPYFIEGNIAVNIGETLTLQPGNMLKFNAGRIFTVSGTLVADGTETERIVFTSGSFTPVSGDWNRIHFNNAGPGTVLNYCDILYAGSASSAIDVNNSGNHVQITNSTVKYSASYGVYIRNGSVPKFINTIITENSGIGIYITGASGAEFGSDLSEWNDVYGNGDYELRNGSLDIAAKYIYWGVEFCDDVPELIYDQMDQSNLGLVDYDPCLNESHQFPPLITTWTGAESPLWNDDANWDKGAPNAGISAIIPKIMTSQPFVVFNEACDNLTMEGGAELTIFSGGDLQVFGDLFMQANENGTSSLTENGGFSVAGNVTVQFYVTADRWHYVSPPMSDQTANAFYDMYLYDYIEATDLWHNIIDPATPLPVGTGYKVWSSTINPPNNPPGTKSVEFVDGNLNSGNYFLPVTYTNNGWNLVGNPYPSAVSWNSSGWLKSKIDATVYVWNGVQYITWNGTVGDLTGGIIPAMQGFMVKATGTNPLLLISNSTRLHGPDPYKASPVSRLFEITVSGNSYDDKTYIHFNEQATTGFDSEFDGYKIYGIEEAPQLYTRSGEDMLRVNVLPEIIPGIVVPVALEVPARGEYTFIFDGLTTFEENITMYLEDIKENHMIEVTQHGQYVFSANPSDSPDRFMLHFGLVGEEAFVSADDNGAFHIYSYQNTVYVQSFLQQEISGSVMIHNMMGQEILNNKLENTSLNKFSLNTGSGYYVVKVLSDSGVYSQKVFIK
ncbi:MAG: right-handed parallel beta-helix repeat-containing protein [Bacteroidales bacterium]